MECVPDSSYTTTEECESHLGSYCSELYGGAIGFFFWWMAWELIGTVVYAVAACKAAKVVPSNVTPDPAHGGVSMQPPVAIATAVAQPTAVAVAHPVAAVPMGSAVVQGTPPVAVAQAYPAA